MEQHDAQWRLPGLARTALHWTALTVSPWLLAAGLLVSFTAVASNDPRAGLGRVAGYGLHVLPEDGLVPGSAATLAGAAGLDPVAIGDLLASPAAALRRAGLQPRGSALRADAKVEAGGDPAVARARKGSPLTALATLSRRGLDLAEPAGSGIARLVFVTSRGALPPTVLMSGPVAGPEWEAVRVLEPVAADDPTTTRVASSVQSPAAAAGSTGAGRDPAGRTPGGATPAVSRASALSSMTPAPAEAVPAEIAAAPVTPLANAGTSTTAPAGPEERPRYADMIAPGTLDREQRCLAEAVYFEARSEPEEGRAAVAQVVLNRVRSGLYPASVCGVVYQNRHRHLACQFTFACEGKALRVTEPDAWDAARRIAADVMEGRTYLAEVGRSTHYHADYVRPSWARKLKRMDVIGRHVFYELRPGQT